ncbi:MAG: hypothetical protein JWP81_1172 [Ferruginibacter sp.]|nr:hypothetical protein [Ferruginibacter sp.]
MVDVKQYRFALLKGRNYAGGNTYMEEIIN